MRLLNGCHLTFRSFDIVVGKDNFLADDAAGSSIVAFSDIDVGHSRLRTELHTADGVPFALFFSKFDEADA